MIAPDWGAKLRYLTHIAAAFFLLVPVSANAQAYSIPGDLCGALAVESAQPLAGRWIAVNRDGGGSVGPRGVLLKSRPKENLDLIFARKGVLVFTGKNDMGDQRMDMVPQAVPDDLPDVFNVQLPNGRIAEIDVRGLLPCPWSKMPGYKGHVDYPLPGVGEMRMTVWFNFPSRSRGFGMLHFTGSMMGNPIDVWRYVTLSRSMKGVIRCKKYECQTSDMKQCEKDLEKERRKKPELCPFPDVIPYSKAK